MGGHQRAGEPSQCRVRKPRVHVGASRGRRHAPGSSKLAGCPRRLWRQDRLGSSVLGDLGPVTLKRSFVLSWSRANAGASVLALPPARSVALDSLLTSLCLHFCICEPLHLACKAGGRSWSDLLMVPTCLAQCLCKASCLPLSADRRESLGPRQKQPTLHALHSTSTCGLLALEARGSNRYSFHPWDLGAQLCGAGVCGLFSWLASWPRRNDPLSLLGVWPMSVLPRLLPCPLEPLSSCLWFTALSSMAAR